MRIYINKKDIEKAETECRIENHSGSDSCPIAQCLKRKNFYTLLGYNKLIVCRTYIIFYNDSTGKRLKIKLNDKAKQIISTFDSCEKVKPTHITLNLNNKI